MLMFVQIVRDECDKEKCDQDIQYIDRWCLYVARWLGLVEGNWLETIEQKKTYFMTSCFLAATISILHIIHILGEILYFNNSLPCKHEKHAGTYVYENFLQDWKRYLR